MASKSAAQSGGIGFSGLLGILFIGLKLAGYIDWSWWWVTAPLWGGLALVLAVLLGVGVIAGTAWVMASFVERCASLLKGRRHRETR